GNRGTTTILISPATASDAARQEAARLGVALWDREALATQLDRHATAYEREREARQQDVEECIGLAIAARGEMLAALEAVEAAPAAPVPSGDRLRTRSQVTAVAAAISAARADALRALLAWETLATDFAAAFGERAARDGSIEVIARHETLREL